LIGEIISHAIGTVMDFFIADKLDRGLRNRFWLRLILLAALAIATGLTAGSLLRVLV
jgi:hypothetical protein